MGIRTEQPVTFLDGDDDIEGLTWRKRVLTDGNAPTHAMEFHLFQRPAGEGKPLDEADLLQDIPAAVLGGITKVQLRTAMRGVIAHLRAKGGVV
jgi:hypothetical protein